MNDNKYLICSKRSFLRRLPFTFLLHPLASSNIVFFMSCVMPTAQYFGNSYKVMSPQEVLPSQEEAAWAKAQPRLLATEFLLPPGRNGHLNMWSWSCFIMLKTLHRYEVIQTEKHKYMTSLVCGV